MAISVVASAANNVRANAQNTGITITHGFSLQNGDVLYAFLGQGDDVGTGWASSSGGTWTQLQNNQNTTGTDAAMGLMRRVVTNAGGEPSSYTFTRAGNNATDNLIAIVVQVRGVNVSGTPENASAISTTLDISDFTPDNVDITTTVDNCAVLVGHLASNGQGVYAGSPKTAGAPSSYAIVDSETYDDSANIAALFLEVAFDSDVGAQGSQAIGSWTGTPDDATSDGYTVAVALLPGAVRSLSTSIIGSVATPDDVESAVVREFAANISAESATPDAVTSTVLCDLATSITGSAAAPDDVDSVAIRDLSAAIVTTSATPDTAASSLVRELAAAITTTTATPDDVESENTRPPLEGVMRLTVAASAPFIQFTVHQTSRG